ncbi:hypothetical protein KC906_04130 [Candidatus Kaiserbacteria bacterium]|nr:hypothetical protein [Candidatus Kaiserbacteria bacterium]MCB9812630.1 hypothetical protein [Candidatus Nomurabacteria bacterium]
MLPTALTALAVSLGTFVVLVGVTVQERRRGRRFFAGSVRQWCDAKADRLERGTTESIDHFVKYMVQLNWYYSIHSVLRTFLRAIVAVYTYFEHVFERNRERTKQLRNEKRKLSELNHLRQMTKHKEETALTPAEQRKLRKKKLEERF